MKNDKKIRVVEYVHTAEGVKPVEALGPEEREKFRRWLLCTWLNGLYLGKAVAYYQEGTEVASNARRYGPEGETDSSASLGHRSEAKACRAMTRGTRAAEVHGHCGGGDGNG